MRVGEIELRPRARGRRAYYAELRAILEVEGNQIIAAAQEMRPLTPRKLGVLALRFQLNLRALTDYLAKRHVVPPGILERITEGGLRPSAILSAALAELEARE